MQVTELRSDALFILLVEKDAAFMRLAEDRFYNTHPCIIITAKGQPDVATRCALGLLAVTGVFTQTGWARASAQHPCIIITAKGQPDVARRCVHGRPHGVLLGWGALPFALLPDHHGRQGRAAVEMGPLSVVCAHGPAAGCSFESCVPRCASPCWRWWTATPTASRSCPCT